MQGQTTIAHGLDKENFNLVKLIKVTHEVKLSSTIPTRLSNTYFVTIIDPVSKEVQLFEQYDTIIKASRKMERIATAIEADD